MSGRRNMNHNMSLFCISKVDVKYFYMVDTELYNMSCFFSYGYWDFHVGQHRYHNVSCLRLRFLVCKG